MNLHSIDFDGQQWVLIAEYMHAYYRMPVRASGNYDYPVEYTVAEGAPTERWDQMNRREALTYTNRAIEWRDRGRPHIPR
jgi:hypothetical protein